MMMMMMIKEVYKCCNDLKLNCDVGRLLLNVLQSVMLQVDELLYHLCHCYNVLLCTKLLYGAESLKITISSDSREICCILCNLQFHYVVQKSPLLVPILSQINPIHTHLICVKSC